MNIKINIDGVDYEGNVEPIVKANIPEIAPKEKTGFERVPRNDIYNSILALNTCTWRENDNFSDDLRFEEGNYFSVNEIANNYRRAILLILKLSRWQTEQDSVPDLKSAFYIKYNHITGILYSDLSGQKEQGLFEVPFSTGVTAERAIKEFYSELKWFFTKFKPNLKWR